ncbi:hypothetical protein CPB84DRAFT_1816006 [Gymnopilus junonius]|uniref:Uncharacterized protein n=1 Tax=Gymnopilus junonius TaxID=109634 RepID=A0A9P5NKK5_GYMJU|nr:hypothetical protein CPB84DRAFT_1816006 [Gymnopilus junonius]
MHLGTFNLLDLLVPLWQGVFNHKKNDPPSNWPWAILHSDTWETHGRDITAATPFLPGSFDQPPHNIAKKINSGYKAWEWLLYLYGLAPALLYGVLLEPYYSHFCKLALYYQGRVDQLHFCWQSIHALLHLTAEVTRIGPPVCSSQWTMEYTIRNLGKEIRQPSNLYANLSQCGLLRCQVNTLIAMIPDLDPPSPPLPCGTIDLGQGYALLCAQDRYNCLMCPHEAGALLHYLRSMVADGTNWCLKVTRWAHLQLPNGQVARSWWKEALKPLGKCRMAHNMKV